MCLTCQELCRPSLLGERLAPELCTEEIVAQCTVEADVFAFGILVNDMFIPKCSGAEQRDYSARGHGVHHVGASETKSFDRRRHRTVRVSPSKLPEFWAKREVAELVELCTRTDFGLRADFSSGGSGDAKVSEIRSLLLAFQTSSTLWPAQFERFMVSCTAHGCKTLPVVVLTLKIGVPCRNLRLRQEMW